MAATPSIQTKLIGEFVGTYLLIFTVGCNVLSGNAVWGGVSIACVLMVAIYALGGICGANFNPAVSLALALHESAGGKGGLDWKTAGMYMATQLVAGVCASLSYSLLFFKTFNLAPATGFGLLSAGLCELLYTFVLCFVVLNVAVGKGCAPNQFYGLAIGFVIVAGAYGAGAVSGGCFNPAVAFGIDLASAGLGFGWCVWYTICEFCGAALAAGLFVLVRPGDFGKESTPATALISEFIGTFVLVLTVGLNVLGTSKAGAFSIAASLMCMIYALGDVSGAHFNPAVTAAIVASGRADDTLPPARAGAYMGAQILGGMVASITYSSIYSGEAFKLSPGPNFGYVEAAFAELIFTFVLCYVVLCVAVSTTTKSSAMFGLAIGACVTVGGNAIGAISGGSLNPAVSIAITTVSIHKGASVLGCLLYCCVEILGGVLAAGVFKATHLVDVDDAAKPLKESA